MVKTNGEFNLLGFGGFSTGSIIILYEKNSFSLLVLNFGGVGFVGCTSGVGSGTGSGALGSGVGSGIGSGIGSGALGGLGISGFKATGATGFIDSVDVGAPLFAKYFLTFSILYTLEKLKMNFCMEYLDVMIGCIYGIELDGVIRYIGSTINFKKRITQHNEMSKSLPVYKLMRTAKKIEYILLEYCDNISKEDRFHLERLCIESGMYPDIVNILCPIRTDEEREAYQQQYQKVYRVNNKTSISEYKKAYIKTEHGKKTKKAQRQKTKERQFQKILCECGKEYTYKHKSRHNKSIFHLDNIPKN